MCWLELPTNSINLKKMIKNLKIQIPINLQSVYKTFFKGKMNRKKLIKNKKIENLLGFHKI